MVVVSIVAVAAVVALAVVGWRAVERTLDPTDDLMMTRGGTTVTLVLTPQQGEVIADDLVREAVTRLMEGVDSAGASSADITAHEYGDRVTLTVRAVGIQDASLGDALLTAYTSGTAPRGDLTLERVLVTPPDAAGR